MKTSSIKQEIFEEQTVYSFNTISEKNNSIIGTPSVFITKYDNNEFFLITEDFDNDIEKTFKNEDNAYLFAMKILLKYKNTYN